MSERAAAPIDASERIGGLDAVRGVALLGILVANVRQMFMPWDVANFPLPLGVGEAAAWADWGAFHALVDLKFLTLFSVLFGIGFAIQAERVEARGEGFTAVYVRRALLLALFGVAHALLLYPAEVLMPYAVAGLILLSMRRWPAATLLRGAIAILVAATLWSFVLGQVVGDSWGAYQHARRQLVAIVSGDEEAWPRELLVHRAGGFADLLRLHASLYAEILFYFLILMLWRTLGLFMAGAALVRSGWLARATATQWRRVAAAGLGIGIPLSLLATGLQAAELVGERSFGIASLLHELVAFLLAAGFAAAAFVLRERASQRWLWTTIEAAGRMPLTNYIGQSLVMALLAKPWGLDLYGRFGGPMLSILAVTVFTMLALSSRAWLSRYRMGPLEWLWRCGTYGRWLPNR